MFTWSEWLQRVSNGESQRDIAARIRVSKSTVARWAKSGNPPADAVIAIARAYGADITTGLVCAGALTLEDVNKGIQDRIAHVPTEVLAGELARRAHLAGSPADPFGV